MTAEQCAHRGRTGHVFANVGGVPLCHTDEAPDCYRLDHPWEQTGHRLYIEPSQRTSLNWPPEPAYPHGPHEAKQWDSLPVRIAPEPAWRRQYGYAHPVAADTWWRRLLTRLGR